MTHHANGPISRSGKIGLYLSGVWGGETKCEWPLALVKEPLFRAPARSESYVLITELGLAVEV